MKRPLMLSAMTLACLATTALRADEPEDVFVGYLFGTPREINYDLYTHLCHAFLTADADGSIKPSRNVPNPALVKDAHAHGVKVLLSLGGWGWDKQFAAIVAKDQTADRYIESVMKIVGDADYDGIDLDWEYPDTEAEVRGFERLVLHFRRELDRLGGRKGGRHMLLTMAASSNPGTLRWLKTGFLVQTMDWVHVMTYDYTGDWTDYAGHHAPLKASSKVKGTPRSAEATIAYLIDERKMPADRLVLGIPLYGRGFGVEKPYAPTKGRAKPKMPEGNYRNIAGLVEKGWRREWDEETQTPWLYSPEGDAVIGYDDPDSVAIKAHWAREKGLRGVFFWEIGADRMPDGSNPLQDAAKKKLRGRTKP